jgi:transcription elongation factor GreA
MPAQASSSVPPWTLSDVDTDDRSDLPDRRRSGSGHQTGLISVSSPIARALIGKHEGDPITISAPGGERNYEIVAVRYDA